MKTASLVYTFSYHEISCMSEISQCINSLIMPDLVPCCVLNRNFWCVADKVGSKALQLTYKDKLRMVALTKQVAGGPYREDAMPAVGFLDVVGNDRK